MRVLLIQPPIEDFYLTQIRTYPLNLICLATALQKAGIEVAVLDCLNPLTRRTRPIPKELNYLKDIYHPNEVGPAKLFGHYYRFGLSDADILKKIAEFKPDVIGISANFTAYFDSIEGLCKSIKTAFPVMKIVLGGYHATVFTKEVLARVPEVDHIIVGEGETALLSYLGINEPAYAFETAIPDHRLIAPDSYRMHRQNMAALVATRGCVKACSFCTVASMYGRSMRWRTLEAIMAEMQQLYDHQHVRVFDFEDDNLSVNRPWFVALLTAIIEAFPDIRLYAMNGIALETLDEELLQLMWRAGFRNLNLSLVAAQETQQTQLHRQTNNTIFEQVVRDANTIGFEVTVYFILGLPGQTANDVEETLSFLYKHNVLVTPSVYYPPPGTSMYENEPWIQCRSSAFAHDTPSFPRAEQVRLFQRVRLLNFAKGHGTDPIGLRQLQEFQETWHFTRAYRTRNQS